MQKLHKFYQFTVMVNILVAGTISLVPVNLIHKMEVDDVLNATHIRNILNSGAARAVKAAGGDTAAQVINSYILHSMYLGKLTELQMFPQEAEPVNEVAGPVSEHSDQE